VREDKLEKVGKGLTLLFLIFSRRRRICEPQQQLAILFAPAHRGHPGASPVGNLSGI